MQPSPLVPLKSSGTPTPSTHPSRSSDLTRQTVSKATPISAKPSKRQPKKTGTAAVRIAKTISRTRQAATTVTKQPGRLNRINKSPVSSFLVSLPRPSPCLQVTSEGTVTMHPPPSADSNGVLEATPNHSTPPPPPPLTKVTASLVTLPTPSLGALPSSSSSGSTSSSGDSDSDDSTSSSSETRNGPSLDQSPVQMVTEAKPSVALVRPKAITSPVKTVPPSVGMGVAGPPPLLSPLISPTGIHWPPSSTEHTSHVGFAPLTPLLGSPTSSLSFSSLGKPHKSAFQLVSPRRESDHTHIGDGPRSNEGTV